MKWLINFITISFVLFLITIIYASNSNAFEGEQQLIKNLSHEQNSSDGLGYTLSEISILENSYIELAEINDNFPSCEVMKLSINMNYNPYYVIKTIYSIGESVDLDKVCMCAVELGVSKSIIAVSAIDARDYSNDPVFSRDEVVQSQCLNEGLGYTEEGKPLNEIKIPKINGIDKPDSFISPYYP